MSGAAAAIILGFLLSTTFAAAFHLLFGGPPGRMLLYIIASCVGFAAGHFIGRGVGIELYTLGALYLLPATLGALIALFISRWLWGDLVEEERLGD